MGFRYMNSTTTALEIDMKTRSIYPRFQVVFDDGFTSIQSNKKYPFLIWDWLIIS